MATETNSPCITNGFHLVVDAMKLNGLDTIYGVAGIPVTTWRGWLRPKAFATSASTMSNPPATRRRSPAI